MLSIRQDALTTDEAISALDLTEQAVIGTVHNFGRPKTIILIAHRLTTVGNCDCFFIPEKGRLVAQGRYGELINSSASSRALTAVQN